MEDPAESSEWRIQEYSSLKQDDEAYYNVVKWMLNKGYVIGKKIAVTGIVITSAPLVLPPLVVISAMGVAVSVPFGLLFASYACTNKLMSLLLPPPPSPLLLEYYNTDECERENNERVDFKLGLDQRDVGDENGDDFGPEVEDNEQMEDIDQGVDFVLELDDGCGDDYRQDVDEREILGIGMEDMLQRENANEEKERARMEDIILGVEMRPVFDNSLDDQRYEEDVGEYLEEEQKGEERLVESQIDENTSSTPEVNEDAKLSHKGKVDNTVEDDYVSSESASNVAYGDVNNVVSEGASDSGDGMVFVTEGASNVGFGDVKDVVRSASNVASGDVKDVVSEGASKVSYGGVEDVYSKSSCSGDVKDVVSGSSSNGNVKDDVSESASNVASADVKDVVSESASNVVSGGASEDINDVVSEGASDVAYGDVSESALASENVEDVVIKGVPGVAFENVEDVVIEGDSDVASKDGKDVVSKGASNGACGDVKDVEGASNVASGDVKDGEVTYGDVKDVVDESASNVASWDVKDVIEGASNEACGDVKDFANEDAFNVASGDVKDVETTKPVTVKEIESQKLVDVGSKNDEPVGEIRHVVILSQGNEDNNFNSREVEELDLVAREVIRDANKDEFDMESDEEVLRESMGTQEIIAGGNASNDASEDVILRNRNINFESLEVGNEVKENTADENADVLACSALEQAPLDTGNAIDATKAYKKMPSREEKLDDEKMWEKIGAMRAIVGYKAPSQPTCIGELKALYVFTGVEPPASFEGQSDMDEVNAKLRFLMAIVGVK